MVWVHQLNSGDADRAATSSHHLEQRKVAAMGKSMLHGFAITIVVLAAALGSAVIATDAVARGGGGTGHGGGGVGGGHFGAAMGGSHFGEGMVRGFSGGHFSGGRLAAASVPVAGPYHSGTMTTTAIMIRRLSRPMSSPQVPPYPMLM